MPVNRGNMRGFTLVEVLVAFAILAFTLAAAYGVFSDSARAVATGEDHGVALALAQSKLAESDALPADERRDGSGEFDDRFLWRIETEDLPDSAPAGTAALKPVLVRVTVEWDSGRSIALETIRLERE